MENISNHLASEATLRRARRYGDLIWADGNLFAYKYRDVIYVMEPPVELTEQLIPLLEQHPIYAEVVEQEFNDEVFAPRVKVEDCLGHIDEFGVYRPYEGMIFDEASDFDWAALQALRHGGGIKVEYIPPAEIVPEIFGETTKAPDSEVFDPAVVMHTIHEMAYSLKECRNLISSNLVNRPLYPEEFRAVEEADELLTDYCSEFGVDMNQKDLKTDGSKLHLG